MHLYYAPGACSLAPHIVALEAGLKVELEKVDLATKTITDGTPFTRINPRGYVPALLLDDGSALTEAAVITQFLADLAPELELMPAPGTMAHYRALEWLNFIATELHKGFGPLWKKETPSEVRRSVKDVLATRFSIVEQHLAGRAYLMGEQFTAPDAYAFTILSWARFMAIDLARWPNIAAYLARIAARPKVREALKAEGLLTDETEAA